VAGGSAEVLNLLDRSQAPRYSTSPNYFGDPDFATGPVNDGWVRRNMPNSVALRSKWIAPIRISAPAKRSLMPAIRPT